MSHATCFLRKWASSFVSVLVKSGSIGRVDGSELEDPTSAEHLMVATDEGHSQDGEAKVISNLPASNYLQSDGRYLCTRQWMLEALILAITPLPTAIQALVRR